MLRQPFLFWSGFLHTFHEEIDDAGSVNMVIRKGGRMKAFILNLNLTNAACIGKHITVCPGHYDEMDTDSSYDVYGPDGHVLYMLGEVVEIRGYDSKKQTVTLWNDQNEYGEELFTIPYVQYVRDFGIYQLPSELLRKYGGIECKNRKCRY